MGRTRAQMMKTAAPMTMQIPPTRLMFSPSLLSIWVSLVNSPVITRMIP